MNQKDNFQYISHFISIKDIDPSFSKPLKDLRSLIEKLPVADSLFVLSRLDAILSEQQGLNFATQQNLFKTFFDEDFSEFLSDIVIRKPEGVIFHFQQIYYTMSLFLRWGKTHYVGQVSDGLIKAIGYILLVVNEILNDFPMNINKGNTLTNHAELLWPIGNFSLSLKNDFGSNLARQFIIQKELEKNISFKNCFKDTVGINSNTYFAIIFTIYSKFSKNKKELITSDVTIDSNNYFIPIESLNHSEIAKTFELLSVDIKKMKDICLSRITSLKNENFNFEFLREKPRMSCGTPLKL